MRAPPLRLDRRTVLQGLGAVGLGWAGAAQALDKPQGPVVLTLSGLLRKPNDGRHAHFDMAMIERLPQTSFSTRTPWYAQARKFTGPLLRDVLAAAGAKGTALRAVALNDYKVEIPVDDAMKYKVVMATRLDGQPMPLREKGPLFIIYPYDESADLRSERFYSRSAWQLRTLEVR